MSLPNAPTRSVAALAADLGVSLKVLRDALRVTLSLVQQLEQHAAYTIAIAQGQPVRIKPEKKPKPPPPANGQPRKRGRPPGAKSNLTLFVSPAEIARLRAAP